jgi:aryl-alcohol dehydrogenase-like predicted oxidoreductase
LRENIASADVELGADVLEQINAIHKQIPNPCP